MVGRLMPRIRTVKPEFWDSPSTARASLRARLFFIAMWNWADDYGVGTANPKALIGFAFPNDDDVTVTDFPTLRKEVADAFGVVFYEVDGRPFYAIPSWERHQRTERRANRHHPAPPDDITAGHATGAGTSEEHHGRSEQPNGRSVVGTGEIGTGEIDTLVASAATADDFATFWDIYPRKDAKGAAVRAWRAARKKASQQVIVAGARRAAAYWRARGTERQFIPHPASWLNAERWADETYNVKPDPRPEWMRQ